MGLKTLQDLAKLIRYYILLMTTTAGSGHASSCLSATDLMTVLFFRYFRADLDNPESPVNDRLIFSKGHASALFYALYAAAGKLTEKELLDYRKFTSNLEGHPTLAFPYTEAPTGSLGQGLSIGLGIALALRVKCQMSNIKYQIPNVYVLLGDGEMAEGSVWEAIQAAFYYKADNLIAILDVNRLGQSGATMYGHDLEIYEKRFESFGWEVITVYDGNDLQEIDAAFRKITSHSGNPRFNRGASRIDSGQARMTNKPTVIIAKTFKGAGVKSLSDKDGWHGKPLPKDLYEQAVKELGEVDLKVRGKVGKPEFRMQNSEFRVQKKQPTTDNSQLTTYRMGDSVATRQAAGDALTSLMYQYPEIAVLDGDVKNSLYTESAQKEYPDRYFEMFIAEQNMTGVAVGLSRRGFIPVVTTFAAFMTRAYDQIRMAGLMGANIKFIGSHAGVSIGEDGASQMGLEDISMFRSIFNSTVLYPSDAASAKYLMEEMVKKKGIVYLRAGRPATPVLYDSNEKFPIGGCKIHRTKNIKHITKNKKIIIVAAGVTLYEALKAQEELAKEGIEAIVVDCYSIKPIDAKTLKSLIYSRPLGPTLKQSGGTVHIITVEDHWFEGGLGDAVLNVFSHNPQPITHNLNIHKLAVTKLPHSGKPQELMDYEGISAKAIISLVKSLFH